MVDIFKPALGEVLWKFFFFPPIHKEDFGDSMFLL